MEDILIKRREAFFNNLILLGLDKIVVEKKYGINFHKDMFVRPNKKGYEVVTYFLFSKLSLATGNDYNIPWPLVCKEHDRLFQKTCYTHLISFSQENCVKFPRFVSSLLSTFGGDRFYEIYLAFSSYVLHKTIIKNDNVRLFSTPTVTEDNFSTAKEILQLSTMLNMKRFQDIQMISYSSYKIWMRFASILEESLRQLKQLLKSYDELIGKKKNEIFSLHPELSEGSFNLPNILEKIYESLKPVLKQRKILDKFLSSEQKYWQYLCSEIGEDAVSEFLNGQHYKIFVSDYLPERHVKELKDTGCLFSDENGKLSVEKFVKIFIVYINFIVDLLRKTNINELEKACFVEDPKSIEDDLKFIKNLNKKLSDEIIPNIETNIKKLQTLTGYDDEENLELSSDLFCLLPNRSYSCEAVQQRTSHFDPSLEKIFDYSSGKQLSNNIEDSSVFLERDPLKLSSKSLTDQNFTRIDSPSLTSSNSSKTVVTTNPSSFEDKNLNYHSSIPVADPSCSKIHIPPLDDLDFSSSSHFKMRESWLKEDSLSSMTLPDVSFDE